MSNVSEVVITFLSQYRTVIGTFTIHGEGFNYIFSWLRFDYGVYDIPSVLYVLTVFCEFCCAIESFSFNLDRFKCISVGNKCFRIDSVRFLTIFEINFILLSAGSKKGFSQP